MSASKDRTKNTWVFFQRYLLSIKGVAPLYRPTFFLHKKKVGKEKVPPLQLLYFSLALINVLIVCTGKLASLKQCLKAFL